jgi:hypothetical protein
MEADGGGRELLLNQKPLEGTDAPAKKRRRRSNRTRGEPNAEKT